MQEFKNIWKKAVEVLDKSVTKNAMDLWLSLIHIFRRETRAKKNVKSCFCSDRITFKINSAVFSARRTRINSILCGVCSCRHTRGSKDARLCARLGVRYADR